MNKRRGIKKPRKKKNENNKTRIMREIKRKQKVSEWGRERDKDRARREREERRAHVRRERREEVE